jgi:EAL domain-containing protein (putative c-di-GMP-specific phosphodiesterase class I)
MAETLQGGGQPFAATVPARQFSRCRAQHFGRNRPPPVEVTESTLFEDLQRALDALRGLRALGVSIAMDDFGTGYSSLSSLQAFPFDKIKIDREFVEHLGEKKQQR